VGPTMPPTTTLALAVTHLQNSLFLSQSNSLMVDLKAQTASHTCKTECLSICMVCHAPSGTLLTIYFYTSPCPPFLPSTTRITDSSGLTDTAQVFITVNPPATGSPPVARDDSATTQQGVPASGNLLSNDADVCIPNQIGGTSINIH